MRRHRMLLWLLWLHAIGLTAYALVRGYEIADGLLAGAIVALIAVLATLAGARRRLAEALVAIGLMSGSALVVHLSDGLAEAHFHLFVVIALLALYEDWVPFLVAVAYVLAHHGIVGMLDPEAVYDHPDAVANPWTWALIHGVFVAAAGLAAMVAWRLNEEARSETDRAYRRASDSEASLAHAQRLARIGSWEWDMTTDRAIWSEAMYEICGLDPDGFEPGLGSYLELVHPQDRELFHAANQRALEGARSDEVRHRIVRSDGAVRTIVSRGTVIADQDGRPVRMVGTIQDVTERHRAEAKVARRATQQHKVAALGERALAGANRDDLMREAVAAVAAVLEIEMASVLELQPGGDELLVRAGVGLPDGAVGRVRIPAGAGSQAGFTVQSGEAVVVEDWSAEDRFAMPEMLVEAGAVSGAGVPIQTPGATFGVLGVQATQTRSFSAEDLDFLQSVASVLAYAVERRTAEDRIRHQALHDPLTGLPNRILFGDRLRQALARSERHGAKVAVLFCDLDRFKLVNDSLGHQIGDRLLRAVALRLTGAMREGDTVSRFGGDEFGIIVEGVEGEVDATRAAERIGTALMRPFAVSGREHFVTASIGIAIGSAGDMPDALIRDADSAMYQAKERGHASYTVFDEPMRARALEHLEIEGDLRRAIDRGELHLRYQPVVRLPDGPISGVEALLRWRHPERGLIGPAEFIPVAEEGGLIASVGRWVLEEACREAAAWDARRPDAPPIWISVNLSARQLAQPTLADEISDLLGSTGLDPACLSLEITEGMLVEESDRQLDSLMALDALGCMLLLDDFGTGFSSLGYVRRLPLDGIKIDRSFVEHLGTEPTDVAIIRAIARMAAEMELSVIAEGVETEAQCRHVEALGCGYAQGHHLAGPVPADRMRELLDEPPPRAPVAGPGRG